MMSLSQQEEMRSNAQWERIVTEAEGGEIRLQKQVEGLF